MSTKNIRSRVTKVIDALGPAHAATALGVSREALLRIETGRDVRNGTMLLVEKNMTSAERKAQQAIDKKKAEEAKEASQT